MTIQNRATLDAAFEALLVNNTEGDIEADELLSLILNFVASASNIYPGNCIYITGDNETEGSIRLIPDLVDGTEAEFQRLSGGVWNDTGIVIAASTVYLGRELQISAGGEYILTKDGETEIKSLVPHVRFDETDGTAEFVVVPKVGTLQSDVILQPDDTGEITASTIQFPVASTDLLLANALILRTGATAASDTVTLNLYRNGIGDGLFYKRNYPASEFPADSDVTLVTDGLVEIFASATFYVEFVSDEDLSLKSEATGTVPYFGANYYELEEDKITPDEQGGDNYMLTFDNAGYPVIDNAGLPVLGNPANISA